MRVLIGCEMSGRVRDAFIRSGHEAISVDLLPTESPGPHHQGDIFEFLERERDWDLGIFFPPCTHLCASGARWWKNKWKEQAEAIEFVKKLWNLPIPRIAIENPIGILSRHLGKPSCFVNPWEYGHGETKKTCLWLKNLPQLVPTHIVEGRENVVHRMSERKNDPRAIRRSRTYLGIAQAMADQWGK